MDRNDFKKRLRAGSKYRPEDEVSLDSAIDSAVMFFWNFSDWSFKKSEGTFASVANQADYELPDRVETILEMTYDSDNKVVLPLPSERISEIYSGLARTGDYTYYFSIHSIDADDTTITLTPIPASVETFTYKYLKAIDYGDLAQIPSRYHGIILEAAKGFLSGNMQMATTLIQQAVVNDKPIIRKRWTMGIDSYQSGKVDERNSVRSTGSSQDTKHPYGD